MDGEDLRMRLSWISRGTLSLVTEGRSEAPSHSWRRPQKRRQTMEKCAPDQQTHGALEAESSTLVLEPPS